VLGLFLVSLHCTFLVTDAYKTNLDNPEDNIEHQNREPSSAFGSRMENDRVNNIVSPSENRLGEMEDMKESLENLVRGLLHPLDQLPMTIDLASPAFREALRRSLLTKWRTDEDSRERAVNTLRALLTDLGKRGWSRVSVQTRFAPFGTKLVPNRKLENGGATLLRYGRNSENP
ncbi:unnamed protein product, partial [Candidula unifasciata]